MARQPRHSRSVEVHDRRPDGRTLVAPERDLRTGRQVALDRIDKTRDRPTAQRPPSPPRRTRAWAVAGVLAVVGVVVAAGVLIATRSTGDDASAPAAPATTQPATTAAPATTQPATTAPAATTQPATTAPAATTQLPTTAATTTPSTTSSTVPAALDPAQVAGYSASSTYTRVLGDAVPRPAVGDASPPFTIDCSGGQCQLGSPAWGWSFTAGAESFDFTVTYDRGVPASPCDPVTETFRGVRAPDGSYAAEFISDPTQFNGEQTLPDGSARTCSFLAITQSVTMTPIVG